MNKIKEEKVRVLRIVEYIGPRSWVEETVSRSIQGKKVITPIPTIKSLDIECSITAVTLTQYPEILEQAIIVEEEEK